MSLLKIIKSAVGLDPDSVTSVVSVSIDNPLFVYVKMPGNIQPLDRADLFEDPLSAVLERTGLGEVTGGGSQLDEPDESGGARVEFAGIDVDLYAVETGLDFLTRELRRLGAPAGTVLLYELNGNEHEVGIHAP
jgi:hypothetical protein